MQQQVVVSRVVRFARRKMCTVLRREMRTGTVVSGEFTFVRSNACRVRCRPRGKITKKIARFSVIGSLPGNVLYTRYVCNATRGMLSDGKVFARGRSVVLRSTINKHSTADAAARWLRTRLGRDARFHGVRSSRKTGRELRACFFSSVTKSSGPRWQRL